ncbi:MAG: transporter substrate-binding domain-containing protein [Alphaproteobacteria bacterium]|nr:transporter substrate-binding domain-containing protein [Alphaproteobacteria bacterium]
MKSTVPSGPRRLLDIAAQKAPAPALAPKPGPAPAKEGALARIERTKRLRVSGPAGELPYLTRDQPGKPWRGLCVDMGRNLATQIEVEYEIVESSAAKAAEDLQAGRFDLFFGLAPSAVLARNVDLSRPLYDDAVVIIAGKDFAAKRWSELGVPRTRVAVESNTPAEAIAHRFAADATITGFKSHDEALAAVKSQRSDCCVATVLAALRWMKDDSQLGQLVIPAPIIGLPVCAALAYDEDGRLREVVNAWCEDNRSSGQTREWILGALTETGLKTDVLPPDLAF